MAIKDILAPILLPSEDEPVLSALEAVAAAHDARATALLFEVDALA
jgi:hypothetical protein